MTHPLYQHKTYRANTMAVTPAYRYLILSHVDYLKNHPKTRKLEIDVAQRNLDLYDFYRYLSNMKYPEELHWVIMIVNDIPNHLELDMSVTELIFPDAGVIEEILLISGIV